MQWANMVTTRTNRNRLVYARNKCCLCSRTTQHISAIRKTSNGDRRKQAMTIGFGLMIAGLSQIAAAFIFFRKPGVRLFFFGWIGRAEEFVTPPGVALWVGGTTMTLVG